MTMSILRNMDCECLPRRSLNASPARTEGGSILPNE
jgi:hypothetical protein